jgi:hypothetical protein
MQWVANLNDNNGKLAFLVNAEKIWAMHNNPMFKLQPIVIWESFQSLISQVKLECSNKF